MNKKLLGFAVVTSLGAFTISLFEGNLLGIAGWLCTLLALGVLMKTERMLKECKKNAVAVNSEQGEGE